MALFIKPLIGFTASTSVLTGLMVLGSYVVDTDSGRWTRAEDSWVVGKRVGWCAMSRGGEAWRGLLII